MLCCLQSGGGGQISDSNAATAKSIPNFIAMAASPFTIRAAKHDDLAAMRAIYEHYVSTALCTWAYDGEVPTASEYDASWRTCTARGLPWLVAVAPEAGGGDGPDVVVGYCTIAPFRARTGWRWTVENSLYTAPGWQRRGVGRALLAASLVECRAARVAGVVAVISAHGPSGVGAASLALHEAAGFTRTGVLPGAGTKGGLVLDCVFMHFRIQDPPVGDGLGRNGGAPSSGE